MRKILLYYPKICGENDTCDLYRGLPLSILSLAAQFDESLYDIKVVDGRIEDAPFEKHKNWLDENIICIGISAITSNQIQDGLDFAQQVRKFNKNIPIVWGGWHSSLMPEQTIAHQNVDIVVVGQGEESFLGLAESLANRTSLDHIPNLLYKSNNKIIRTWAKHLSVLEATAPIEKAYAYINVEDYIKPMWGSKRVIGYETSRGCPWRCRFCSIGSLYNGKWSCLSADRVVNGIEYLFTEYNIDAIHFFDNNFFVNKERVLQISKMIIERNIKIKWDGTSTVEQFLGFTDDYIGQLKESGFYRVIIGVESGDEEVLARIDKRHKNYQVIELVKKCSSIGIQASLSFMVGFPWNPEKDFNETIKLIELLKNIDTSVEILLFIFSPYIGTDLYNVAIEHNMLFPESLEGWANYTYDKVNTPWISNNLRRKINRYISFFGTKDISEQALLFYKGGNV